MFPVCDDARDSRDRYDDAGDFRRDRCEYDVTLTSPGDVILRVVATDDDVSGEGGGLRYELIDDAASARLLAVNATSGELYALLGGADLVEDHRTIHHVQVHTVRPYLRP